MRVYLHSDRAEKAKTYTVTVAPAADHDFAKDGVSDDWKHPDGSAKQIEVVFANGSAEVPDGLARYLVVRGIAHRSRLVRAVRQFFTRDGHPVAELFDQHGNAIVLGGALVSGEAAHA